MGDNIPTNDPRRLAEDLIQDPRETLGHELKDWLDPSKDDDKAILVRAILAMSNSEFGGVIAIGIDDSRNHKAPPPGLNVQAAYEQEAIQLIVSNYASRRFEVQVYFVKHNTIEHPVIIVPGAGIAPVVCRRAIGQGPRPSLREGTIYVRTPPSCCSMSDAEYKHNRRTQFTAGCH
jgi:Putative DNA-binding domain